MNFRQIVAENGNNLLPFSATICCQCGQAFNRCNALSQAAGERKRKKRNSLAHGWITAQRQSEKLTKNIGGFSPEI